MSFSRLNRVTRTTNLQRLRVSSAGRIPAFLTRDSFSANQSRLKLRDGGSLHNPGQQHGEFRTKCANSDHNHQRAHSETSRHRSTSGRAQQRATKTPRVQDGPTTFSGKGDFREWKRKIDLTYEAKGLTPEEKLTWTLPLLQESAARVATHSTSNLSRAHDSSHHKVHRRKRRVPLPSCPRRKPPDRVNRGLRGPFLDLSSRLPDLADAEAKCALINGLKSEVQIHLLGQAHVTTHREALAELRVYAQARRGARPTTGSRADTGTVIGPTPMELDATGRVVSA